MLDAFLELGDVVECRCVHPAHVELVAVWSELGDCRWFSRSDQAVRNTGPDVTVDASDRRRAGGYLSRRGPQALRWAQYVVELTVRPRRASYLQLQQSDSYQPAIPDRIGGVRVPAVVLSDDTEHQPKQ